MRMLKAREATTEELCLAHTWGHIDFMRKTSNGKKDLREMGEQFNSIYLHPTTFKCAKLAVGSTIEVMENVLNGEYLRGISVVRPPGHHAEEDHPHGFCIFNNIALAAQCALKNHGLKRYDDRRWLGPLAISVGRLIHDIFVSFCLWRVEF